MSDLDISCVVLRVMRAVCDKEQKELAHDLGTSPKALSAIERFSRGVPVPREILVRSALAMHRPESFVDSTYAFVRKILETPPLQSEGLEGEIEATSDRVGATYSNLFREASLTASREALAVIERAVGETLWRFFIALPDSLRSRAMETETLFRRWGFVERLWRESLTAAADDAGRALGLAELALRVAERMIGDPVFLSRLKGLAYSGIANARRVVGELPAADQDLLRAKGLWEAGASADPGILDEARFHSLESSLRAAQRLFSEALDCIDLAFSKAKPGADVSYLLITKANILVRLQRHEQAAPIYREAIAKTGPSTSAREAFGARFNLSVCLIALGRPGDAEDQLPGLRKMAVAIGNGPDLLRVRWLEGQVLAGFGHREEAIQTLEEARDGFLARGMLFDVALVGLERAALQLDLGWTAKVKAEAPELAEIFHKLGVAPELLASLALFCAAAQAERATAEQARIILAQLRQAAANPPSPA